MLGTVYFLDGHTETITSYNTNPKHSELYFRTKSGQYGFEQHVEPQTYDVAFVEQLFLYKAYRFYKYYEERNQWLVAPHIEHIEIYTEVLPHD